MAPTSLLLSHLACYSGYILTFANRVIFLYCVHPVCVLEGDTDVCADVSIHGDGEMALQLRSRFGFQHPHGCSQPSVTSFLGDPMTSPGSCGHHIHMCYTVVHAGKTTHVHKIKISLQRRDFLFTNSLYWHGVQSVCWAVWLASSSRSVCLCLPHAGITNVWHHIQFVLHRLWESSLSPQT